MGIQEISFFVAGTPRPQGSKHAFRHRSTGKIVLVESAGQALKKWRDLIESQALLQSQIDSAVVVDLGFFFARPKSHWGRGVDTSGSLRRGAPIYPTGRPDVDKLCRAVLDSISCICGNDSRVVDLRARKHYATDSPGVQVRMGAV